MSVLGCMKWTSIQRGGWYENHPFASSMGLTGTGEQVSEKIAGLAALGVTEVVYQPGGSDIARELRAFASAAGLPSPN